METPEKKIEDNKKLKEKDFIDESQGSLGVPIWLFAAIVLGIFGILWMIGNWASQSIGSREQDKPFLQVTNRQMSLFLWQNPEKMRINVRNKTGYLPGFFSVGKANPKPETIDEYVAAPPELLFEYHTWDRLLGAYLVPRTISEEEFREFLQASPEWNATYWPSAPAGYKQLLDRIAKGESVDISHVEEGVLPKQVLQAFFGWKNYYKEGDAINAMRPTVSEIQAFLAKYPHYERSYWRNLYPDYLKIFLNETVDPHSPIPQEQLAPFLRAVYFNTTRLEDSNSEAQTKPSS